MSILDGMPSNEAQLKGAVEFANPIIEQAIAKLNLTERQQSAGELMKEGLSIADIMGISKQHRDAMLVQGIRLLQAGDVGKARDALTTLYQMEPLDERVIYALANTYQVEGDFAAAGKLYVTFLALDATNPEGYLRLGECFLGAKEYGNATDTFEIALNTARRQNDEKCAAYADKMLAIAREQGAAKPSQD
jgi:uncharacterized protein HemY